MLADELSDLRRRGLRVAGRADFPELAKALRTWDEHDRSQEFGIEIGRWFSVLLAPYVENPLQKILMEIFCLDPSTQGMNPTAARKHAVKRVRGVEPRTDVVDAFAKNQQKKALGLLEELITQPGTPAFGIPDDSGFPWQLRAALVEANITRFFSSREGYKKYRDGRDSISKYVSSATTSIEMVSINLATGTAMEEVTNAFEAAVLGNSGTRIVISLLDPERDYLMESIAPILGISQRSLVERINDAITSISDLREERLPRRKRHLVEVWCHRAIPNASAILLDADLPSGRIQLETKGFRTGMNNSWGFEVGHGSDFYSVLRKSYRDLIADGRQVF